MDSTSGPSWEYLKLYFGTQSERADAFLAELCRRMSASRSIDKWFFLRYVDETGFHVRLRFLPKAGEQEHTSALVRRDCGEMLDRMYDFLPGTYRPMVSLPDYMTDGVEVPQVDPRLRIASDAYVPESDKYGRGEALAIAEGVFHLSSTLAGRILRDEEAGLYSRKTLAPWLMHEPAAAFPSRRAAEYWAQYSLYWLGGDSPAAQDWRQRFKLKADELREAGHPVLQAEAELPREAAGVVRDWRAGLLEAARGYRALGDGAGVRRDVLSLNFSHLMMNRLGIATLEESYLATLLEMAQQDEPERAVA